MTIQSFLGPNSGEVFTIRATETVKSAAEQMRQHGVSALVVKDDEAITGMISDRDIVYAASRRGEAAINLSGGVGQHKPFPSSRLPPPTASSAPWA